MIISAIPWVVLGLAIAIPGTYAANRNPLFACWYYGSWTVACTVLAALNAAQGSWGWAVCMAVCAAIHGYRWWQSRNRRQRKRAAARKAPPHAAACPS